jgi:hypothetical protein
MENQKKLAQLILEKVSSLLKRIGTVAVLASALIGGFCIGYYYNLAVNKVNGDNWRESKTLTNTSVAVNEKAELLIIDRKTGVYTIYSDSIGKVIFNIYAQKAYVNATGH